MNPFETNNRHGEVIKKEICKLGTEDIVFALIGIIVVYGINRTERAIKNTWTKNTADKIIITLNEFMASVNKDKK